MFYLMKYRGRLAHAMNWFAWLTDKININIWQYRYVKITLLYPATSNNGTLACVMAKWLGPLFVSTRVQTGRVESQKCIWTRFGWLWRTRTYDQFLKARKNGQIIKKTQVKFGVVLENVFSFYFVDFIMKIPFLTPCDGLMSEALFAGVKANNYL
jgi:hypothetical protein